MTAVYNKPDNGKLAAERDPFLPLFVYPVETFSYHALTECTLDESGVPYRMNSPEYQPAVIAQYGLAQWNLYLINGEDQYCHSFMQQARWLVSHVVRVGSVACGWPIAEPSSALYVGLWGV